MVWRLVRKVARLYALIALVVLGLMLASEPVALLQLDSTDFILAAFFPYGVLTGLILSLLFMRAGGWITILSLGGFYLTTLWQSGIWPSSEIPMLIAGSGPLFILAGFLQSMGRPRKKRKKRSHS